MATLPPLTFSIFIQAPRNVVWHVLWNDPFYRQWTQVFAAGSHAKSSWSEGSKILFLDENNNGMYSTILNKKEPESIVFCHHGNITNGQKGSPEKWDGATETFTLTEENQGTRLNVSHDVSEPWADFLKSTFPKALDRVKQLSETKEARTLSIHTQIQAPIDLVWNAWVSPSHVKVWNHASDDWHTPYAENHFHVGGHFIYTMAAKDGSVSFDFKGKYIHITENAYIAYTIEDGRQEEIFFKTKGNVTEVIEMFEAETKHPLSLQQHGWQQILENFKKHVEKIHATK